MSITINLTDMHPQQIKTAVVGTQLENDVEFERVLMRYLRPSMIPRPMPNVTQVTMTLNLLYKDISVIININPTH